jgi:cysteine synthase B
MRSDSVIEAIGYTPLVEIARMSPKEEVRLFAKLEGQNLGGSASAKDRIAKYMLEKAEERGMLTAGMTIIEATSGNTGIALAMVGRRKGYKVKILMPESATTERKQLIQLYGAELILTDAAKGVDGSLEVAKEMVAKDKSYFMPDQFTNPDNSQAHYETTGREILEDLPDLEIDALVCGIGTGGTIAGVGRRLREKNPKIKLIGVEPCSSEDIDGLRCSSRGSHPSILAPSLLDQRVTVRREEAIAAARELLEKEGIFAGLSSGAAIYQAIKVAQEMKRGNIVVVLPDGGWKYLSLGIWG